MQKILNETTKHFIYKIETNFSILKPNFLRLLFFDYLIYSKRNTFNNNIVLHLDKFIFNIEIKNIKDKQRVINYRI